MSTNTEARESLSEFLMKVYDHGTQPNALREADAVLAWMAEQGYSKPREAEVLDTAEAVEALTVGTVVLTEQGGVWQQVHRDRFGPVWYEPGHSGLGARSADLSLPVRVLHDPAVGYSKQHPRTVTDEMVEAAGEVMYSHWSEWHDDSDASARGHVELVRSALTAALGAVHPAPQEPTRFDEILNQVAAEAVRSIEKHGEQAHLPLGTGFDTMPLLFCGDDQTAEGLAQQATYWTDEHSHSKGDGTVTWWDILAEEVFEASAEEDHVHLRAELVQVAAVVVKMIDAIDRPGEPVPQDGDE